MVRRPASLVLATSLALLGCKPSDDDPKPSNEAEPGERSPTVAAPRPIDPALAGPIRVSKAVPADAAAVVVLRSPERLLASASLRRWLGPQDPAADAAMFEEIDAYLGDRIGVKLTAVNALTVYYADSPERFGVIVEGVEGVPKGREHSRHGDSILRMVDGSEDVLATSRGSQLLLGNAAALTQMLDTLDGKSPALVDDSGPLASLLASESAGAALAVAAELAKLPRDLAEPATQMGVERAFFGLGGQGLHVVASGTPEGMQAAAKLMELAVSQAQAQLDEEKQRAMAGDDVGMGVAAIVGSHTGKQLATILKPKLDGGRMTVDVPLGFGDTTPIVALLGVGAAVAIPALQKYMRRAKTAEAKVQLARLYDATASYFKEEHVARGVDSLVESAPHQCPNNGSARGEAGITPPLSVNCNEGPGGRCVPAPGGGAAGYYDIASWTDNPVWNGLNFMQEQGHYFHYNFIWANDPDDSYGRCQFTVQAFADLDDDGIYSTYERYGAGDVQGINAAIGLYIDNEIE